MLLLYRMLFVVALLLLVASLPLWAAGSGFIPVPTIGLLILSFLAPILWPIALGLVYMLLAVWRLWYPGGGKVVTYGRFASIILLYAWVPAIIHRTWHTEGYLWIGYYLMATAYTVFFLGAIVSALVPDPQSRRGFPVVPLPPKRDQ